MFLPISYLASLFGITTVSWPVIWYLWAAIPIVIASIAFTLVWPWSVRKVQRWLYPIESLRIQLQPRNFTMLGDELPASVDIPGGNRDGKVKRKARRLAGMDGTRSRSRVREKFDDD